MFPIQLYDKTKQNVFTWVKDVQKGPVTGMPHMLELCGLELEGKHHSGIDDAKNIARIAISTLEKGFEFH